MVAETFRSGAFLDETVNNLITRRFVANFYDMAPPGKNAGDAWAYDEDAVKAVGDVLTGIKGAMQDSKTKKITCNYYAAVFLTPAGKRVYAFQGLPSPHKMVDELRKVLKDNPDFAKPTAEEAAMLKKAEDQPKDPRAQLEAARLAWLVADMDECLKYTRRARAALPAAPEPWAAEIPYLEARVELWQAKRDEVDKLLDEAQKLDAKDTTGLADDIQAARARGALDAKDYARAVKMYDAIVADHPKGNRAGEALYYGGVAKWYAGDQEAALVRWRQHVKDYPKDRLARRSAISQPGARSFHNQELVDRVGW